MRSRCSAFTLAELLIALVILGLIATFTIPKVLNAQQSSQYNAVAKETIGMVSGAYQAYQQNVGAGSATRFHDLTPFMNYVRTDTVSTIDSLQDGTTNTCNFAGTTMCLRLHNGAIIRYATPRSFGATDATSAIWFHLDPDGKVTTDGSAGSAGKAVSFFIYYNGRIATHGDILANTMDSGATFNPDPTKDPPWFSWN